LAMNGLEIAAASLLVGWLISIWILVYKLGSQESTQTEILKHIDEYLTEHGRKTDEIHSWLTPEPPGDQNIYLKVKEIESKAKEIKKATDKTSGYVDRSMNSVTALFSKINDRLTGLENQKLK